MADPEKKPPASDPLVELFLVLGADRSELSNCNAFANFTRRSRLREGNGITVKAANSGFLPGVFA